MRVIIVKYFDKKRAIFIYAINQPFGRQAEKKFTKVLAFLPYFLMMAMQAAMRRSMV